MKAFGALHPDWLLELIYIQAHLVSGRLSLVLATFPKCAVNKKDLVFFLGIRAIQTQI
jgi:hypothetical protein